MALIVLKAITFDQPKFRNLGAITIDFAERITVLAGHNGIGKSTILGLVANGSGLSDAENKSYLNRAYQANLSDIVHLDYQKEYEHYRTNKLILPSPGIRYDVAGVELVKRCSITGRTDSKRVRVVPRNDPHTEFNGVVKVGPDAKVPLPTLYLGMTRMLPVGESNPAWVTSSVDKLIHSEDAEFIREFVLSVISSGQPSKVNDPITTQSIKGTGKTAKHPKYSYSSMCISLGQDSLGAIATAVASFKKLKRDLGSDYPGGLLVIDEVDAGFHPHAQARLVAALANAARHFDLQILATTHSINLIEAVHPDAKPAGGSRKYIDQVVYLTDTVSPRNAVDYSLEDIRRDMSLLPPPSTKHSRKVLKVYLEDAEAGIFLERLLTARFRKRVLTEVGVRLKPLPVSLGCDVLQSLYKHDAHFKSVLIALDADSTIRKVGKEPQNVVKLPGAEDDDGAGLSPERTLYAFIYALSEDNDRYPDARNQLMKHKITRDYLRELLLSGDTNIAERKSAKKWMQAKLDLITEWKLIELWLKEHPLKVTTFEECLIRAAHSIMAAG